MLSKLTKKIVRLFIVNEKNRNIIINKKAGLIINSEKDLPIHRIKTIINIQKETASILSSKKCSL